MFAYIQVQEGCGFGFEVQDEKILKRTVDFRKLGGIAYLLGFWFWVWDVDTEPHLDWELDLDIDLDGD